MKTNLLPDSCGELSLILSSPAVKLPHLPFADFSPWGPCSHKQNVTQHCTLFIMPVLEGGI